MRHDYKLKDYPQGRARRPLRRHHVAAVVSFAVCAGLVALWVDRPAEGKQTAEVARSVQTLPLPPAPAADQAHLPDDLAPGAPAAPSETVAPEPPGERTVLEVRSGDSLDRLFRRHDLSVADLQRLLALKEAAPHLKRVRPGDTFEIHHDGASVLGLTRRLDETRTLVVEQGEAGYEARFLEHPVEIRLAQATGQITSSFYAAGLAAGLSDGTIMRLAGIYAWDIDFALEIRRDDWFAVVYEEIWQDGAKLRDGEIVAAEFSNQGRSFRAVRFPDEDGRASYYTPEGDSMRKAFLRAPVDFTRVSSNFNPNRLHPVLKTKRPHRGVDYAARTGTPIMAAGDGKVISAGTQGGYGKTVVLQHGGNVTTLYAHMSRIGSNAKVGRRVKQGDIIGYVGATGLASGPHLHYEYRVNGVHKNPRTVDLPKAEPVPAARRAEFAAAVAPLIAELDRLGPPLRLAAAD
ncbi:peptidoglycan DD-metalloendopeptidase family protein [Thioalkalivibrio sp. XN279]|uniref:peptidoglycan DD-metalloendopeptidase family protein n=1 Tax=Thioalkalivibrio sp. XN279 TaxID=2714953 RepID=UPI00197E3ADF